jgi:ubiquinone/menaquinone biosynthesis C-methylase UbiE
MANEEKERAQLMHSWQSKEAAAQWARQAQQRQSILGEATRLMLEAAELRPGDHVLDIAAGAGDQSLLAARKVGPAGTVLATDISVEMLKEAVRAAEQQGLTNVTTRVMNAEQLELADQTCDAVICRMGLMLVVRQREALREILRVLKPGRKLAALVWSTAERNPFFSIPLSILAKYVAGPASTSGPFSLAGTGVFEQALKEAGFREVSVRAVPIQLRFPSVDAYFQQMPSASVANAIRQFDQQDRQRLQEEIKQALIPFERPEGLVFPGELLLGVGTK